MACGVTLAWGPDPVDSLSQTSPAPKMLCRHLVAHVGRAPWTQGPREVPTAAEAPGDPASDSGSLLVMEERAGISHRKCCRVPPVHKGSRSPREKGVDPRRAPGSCRRGARQPGRETQSRSPTVPGPQGPCAQLHSGPTALVGVCPVLGHCHGPTAKGLVEV